MIVSRQSTIAVWASDEASDNDLRHRQTERGRDSTAIPTWPAITRPSGMSADEPARHGMQGQGFSHLVACGELCWSVPDGSPLPSATAGLSRMRTFRISAMAW